jgi:hypothetical protein
VLPKLLAVVGEHDDDRVVEGAARLQRLPEAPELGVGVGRRPFVASAEVLLDQQLRSVVVGAVGGGERAPAPGVVEVDRQRRQVVPEVRVSVGRLVRAVAVGEVRVQHPPAAVRPQGVELRERVVQDDLGGLLGQHLEHVDLACEPAIPVDEQRRGHGRADEPRVVEPRREHGGVAEALQRVGVR